DHLIPGLGSSPTGAHYSFRDTSVAPGMAYYYLLEDHDTEGGSQRHGPVSAAPVTTPGGAEPPPSDDPIPGGVPYGDPSKGSLRVVERDLTHAVVELLTGGFVAVPEEDGTVRIRVPGFEDADPPGTPALAWRRALVEAVAGRGVVLSAVE